jgi:hypothetical protein
MIVSVGTIKVTEPGVQIEGQATNDGIARRREWEATRKSYCAAGRATRVARDLRGIGPVAWPAVL